ncbi:hypothetical protein [Ruegeria halocynthiae]|uniref:hypothetical protein n=1 Tax=Ruegeria halocynthiae TaxID=985054 RepID=UPI00115FBC75|nr:hypothetical protein [Ruegeria halocynthiae]
MVQADALGNYDHPATHQGDLSRSKAANFATMSSRCPISTMVFASQTSSVAVRAYAPVVLKLPKMPLDRVEDERGVTPDYLDMPDGKVSETVMGQHTFRMKGVVPFDLLQVFEAEQTKGNEAP